MCILKIVNLDISKISLSDFRKRKSGAAAITTSVCHFFCLKMDHAATQGHHQGTQQNIYNPNQTYANLFKTLFQNWTHPKFATLKCIYIPANAAQMSDIRS
jgi:hypothetical protein